MKNIFSPDSWKNHREAIDYDRERLDRLQIGSAVEFGFMPQLALSAKRFKVTGVRTYAFDEDKFISYALDHGLDHHVNMIVAEAEGEKYLSISRHISSEEAQKLFSAQSFDEVMEKFSGDRIQCREGVVGFLGWTANSYRKVMEHVHGQVCDGDYRDFPLPQEPGLVREFQYALFVSDTDEYAIEIERHLDDRVELFATVYRRATDVARVFPPMKLFSSASEPERVKPEGPSLHVVATRDVAREETVSVPPTPVVHAELVDVAPVPSPAPAIAIPVIRPVEPELVAQKPNFNKPRKKSVEMAAETHPSAKVEVQEREMLECDMRVAGKIIEEAQRNQMTLSDLVRKILDLPVELTGTVQIPVHLSASDLETLAARYRLETSDRPGIRRCIVEELAGFAGEKRS